VPIHIVGSRSRPFLRAPEFGKDRVIDEDRDSSFPSGDDRTSLPFEKSYLVFMASCACAQYRVDASMSDCRNDDLAAVENTRHEWKPAQNTPKAVADIRADLRLTANSVDRVLDVVEKVAAKAGQWAS
jgi:hypothetical protein